MKDYDLTENIKIRLTSEDEKFEYICISPSLNLPGIKDDFGSDTRLNKGQVNFRINFQSLESLFLVYFDLLREGWIGARVSKEIGDILRGNGFCRERILSKKEKFPGPQDSFIDGYSISITINLSKELDKFKSYLLGLSNKFGVKIGIYGETDDDLFYL